MQELEGYTPYGEPFIIHVVSDESDVKVAVHNITTKWEVRSDQ